MNRVCAAAGLLLGSLIGLGVGAGMAAVGPPGSPIPLLERLPGVLEAPSDSARSVMPPPLLVDRFGVGLTSRSLAGSDPLPGDRRSIPCLTACYSRIFFPGLGWTAAIGYGRRSGSGDDPTFVQPDRDRVELVPIELGFRFCRERPGLLDWGLDLGVLAIWLRETAPPPYPIGPLSGFTATTREYRRWVAGGRAAAGPRFRLPWHRLVVDLAGGIEITSTAESSDGWSADATSASWRVMIGRER